ncbi:type II secretion system F family protein [Azospirillum picis]|uniref:Flp pilus assembly protein TadB n=1 Tax=Azospirillum picis TaxID=488438 RepID=A0ABU0MNV8_9PROT|nr:type II secretion system F family protein [Azospirillum picis]MBP2301109.1 Flp pilus assembly protein TadB [Azospirillum picis]MDQ0534929.1 Flp pilus assembly protein TadB [Azospirillum picis]
MTPAALQMLAPGIGAFLLILGVILLFVVLREALTGRRRAVAERLATLGAPAASVIGGDAGPSVDGGDDERHGVLRHLERLIEPAGGWRALRPTAAGALLAFGTGLLLAGRALPMLPAAAVALAVGLFAGRQILAFLTHRRTIRFLDHLPDAIDLVVRATRAGVPVSEAIVAAGQETEEPVRSEFRRVADAVSIGVDLKDALREAALRIRLPDFDFFVVALIVQRETGGQLAETLGNLSDILRKRKDMRLKVKALTAEGRMSAYIVTSLPFVTGGMIFAIDPSYMLILFRDPVGHMLLLGAAGCLGAGTFAIGRMTRAEA